jgi:hypothetical protein
MDMYTILLYTPLGPVAIFPVVSKHKPELVIPHVRCMVYDLDEGWRSRYSSTSNINIELRVEALKDRNVYPERIGEENSVFCGKYENIR